MIVYANPPHTELLRHWLDDRLESKVADHSTFIGRVRGETPVAVCAFSCWTDDDVELSLAADDGSGTHGLVAAIFGYVFHQLKCSRCTARVRSDNTRSLALVRRLGFVEEGVQRKGRCGKDLILFGMLKEECKWLARLKPQPQ